MLFPKLHFSFKTEMSQMQLKEKILYNMKHSNYAFKIIGSEYVSFINKLTIRACKGFYRSISSIIKVEISKDGSYSSTTADFELSKSEKTAMSFPLIGALIIQVLSGIAFLKKTASFSFLMLSPMLFFALCLVISHICARIIFKKLAETLFYDIKMILEDT